MKRTGLLALVILTGIALISVAGCGSRAQEPSDTSGPAAANSQSLTKYGFSFECPDSYLVWTDGLLDEQASQSSGIIQIAPELGDFPLYAVSWVRTWKWGLEGGLEAGFEGIANWEGISNIQKGQLYEGTKKGHRMLYQVGHRMLSQYYTASTAIQGEMVYGVVASFYCDDTERTFSLVTMNKSAAPSQQQAIADFEAFLNAFACH
jgi:hypothetical protein